MADPKKPDKKDGAKKEAPPSSVWSDFAPLWIILGGAFFISAFVTNWNGVFFNIEKVNPDEPNIVASRNGSILTFPTGSIMQGIEVVNKETSLVRDEPAGGVLGRQPRYDKAQVKNGPVIAYGERWWWLDYEEAPDGWVAEESITSYVSFYRAINIIPISWGYLKILLWIISAILIAMIVYAKTRLEAAQEEAKRKILGEDKAEIVPHIIADEKADLLSEEPTPAKEKQSNERWMHVLQLLESYNQSDWRQAVIEADIILEEMLDKMGYDGNSIGDKLKNVESSDFLTLNQAWEAHKVRNRIAHMGSEFKVSKQEAQKAVSLYQEVFEEFYFI